ncbi:hypothetical protein [Lewinella sp. JB7]|uniref:hypothetical protein n=1 Tax=Lewinella sp. JB7 TaxID=2962887 RepID=UPI0020C989FC|nr:hypothetical protein [Lewinella sp. JB7]MCP9235250.1 hypothetical protein [Lewinella sp. JB7]
MDFSSKSRKARFWFATGLTQLIAGPLTLWGIYGIGTYGIALFVLTPFLIGLCSTVLYGYGRKIHGWEAARVGFTALAVFTVLLLLFAIEGAVCIAMVAPIAVIGAYFGTIAGKLIVNRMPDRTLLSIALVAASITLLGLVEAGTSATVQPVVTRIIINAPPQAVWKRVVAFPELDPPREMLFRAGISYPIRATITGKGIGAIRYCTFNTGSFVEPITVWDEPRLLAFTVEEQPEPLREISPWDVAAPHLHDYFVSQRGQFRLTELPDGRTELEGTTWYYHDIHPDFYWRLWSDYIIHRIHDRVLGHIKTVVEREVTR